jgi:hypothetical protein
MLALRSSTISELDGICRDRVCPDAQRAEVTRGKTYTVLADLLLGVGVVAIGTSAVLILVAPSSSASSAGASIRLTY